VSIFKVEISPGPADYASTKSCILNYHKGASFKGKPKDRVEHSPGPQSYRSEKSDSLTRPRSPVVAIYKQKVRQDSLGISALIQNPGPAAYNTERKSNPKMSFTIPKAKK